MLHLLDTSENIDKLFKSYQNDKMTEIKNQLDESKMIILDSLEALLHRGESIDDLLIRSQQLEDSSFIFARKTKEMNR